MNGSGNKIYNSDESSIEDYFLYNSEYYIDVNTGEYIYPEKQNFNQSFTLIKENFKDTLNLKRCFLKVNPVND